MPDTSEQGAPEIVKVTADLLGEDYIDADSKADMLLLLLTAGGSILGALSGAVSAYILQRADPFGARSILLLLLWVVLGGAIGCGGCLLILGARGLIRWEKQQR